MRVFLSLLWMSFSNYYLHINNLSANLTPKLKSEKFCHATFPIMESTPTTSQYKQKKSQTNNLTPTQFSYTQAISDGPRH